MIKFPVRPAYAFATENGLEKEATVIRKMPIKKWNRPIKTGVKRAYLANLFQQNNLLDAFIKKHWNEGLENSGVNYLKFIEKIKEDYETFLVDLDDGDDSEEDNQENLAFPMENHLRDFLLENLDKIEPGLKLFVDQNEVSGKEYRIDGGSGRIDILAIDKNNKLVVIELKVSNGKEKVLGQILCYMGWVDENLGMGTCRGIIIANEISQALRLGAARVPDIQLAHYKMKFSVEPVTIA